MEPAAAWGSPFEFQLTATNWTSEEAPAQGWAAHGAGHQIPLEYASIVDIFGSSCSLQQPYVVPASSSSSSGGQQLVECNYYYAAAAAAAAAGEGTTTTTQEKEKLGTYVNSPEKLFVETSEKFNRAGDVKFVARKMHRYPPSIRADLGNYWRTVPKIVAIGPYHHHRDHLQKAEEVKHVAADHCLVGYKIVNKNYSSLSIRDMYHEVISVVEHIDARSLYDKDVMAGISYEDDFLPMMFYDACFLVMYILRNSGAEVEQVLYNFFGSNDDDIFHDIMLLENQIPWPVVDAIMNKCMFRPSRVMNEFIARWNDGWLQENEVLDDDDYNNKPPHLLGLLKFHTVGKIRRSSGSRREVPMSHLKKIKWAPISVSAIELAEIGIFLTAKETTDEDELQAYMDPLHRKWIIFAKIPIAPMCLNELNASWLVNMAALELCTTPDFLEAKHEDSAVCSYLLLLCMLMHREEDVHVLRTKGILKGAGLTNKEVLEFFTRFHSLRKGRTYSSLMVEIEGYKVSRWWGWLKLYTFWYRNQKTIAWAGSAIGGFIGILVAIVKIKDAL